MKAILFNSDFYNSHIPEIIKELYIDKVYDFYFAGKKDLTILDIGANIGLFSFYAHEYASKIYAIEPSADHQKTMQEMFKFNGFDKVVPVQLAISHKDGTADFYHNENVTMFSLRPEVNSLPKEKETVRTATLATFFKENNIKHVDFMKIDVEGAEAEIFGSDSFNDVSSMIDTIVGEFHVWTGLNPRQFETYFKDRGFSFEWLNKTQATIFLAERIC